MLGNEMKSLAIVLMLILTGASYPGAQSRAEEEQAIKTLLTRFYDGWNAYDSDAMVSIYAEDIDHINVWGEWNKGKEAVRKDLAPIQLCLGPEQPKKVHDRKDAVCYVPSRCRSSLHRSGVCFEFSWTYARNLCPAKARWSLAYGEFHQCRATLATV